MIAAAVETGIGFFDIADLYGAEPGLSETMFGTAMRELNLNRDDLIIVTKIRAPYWYPQRQRLGCTRLTPIHHACRRRFTAPPGNRVH